MPGPAAVSVLRLASALPQDHRAPLVELPLGAPESGPRGRKWQNSARHILHAASASSQRPSPDSASASIQPFPFTLQHLVTFQAVACADCVDTAAEHLGLSKRSVLSQLAKLEETVSLLTS